MGDLKDNVSKQIMAAMKAKDKTRLSALRYLKKLFIENDTSKKPINELDIVISYAKKVKDSIALYPDGSPQQQGIKDELVVLEEFLPKQLTKEEVQEIIDEIKSNLDNPNMGAMMKELTSKIRGKFDGREASNMVKESLK